jgi:tRNA(fMet)-specific endonuclease VapC
MADKGLMVDSTILIDFYRKTEKSRTRLVAHFEKYETIYISVITEFEVVNGATAKHLAYWDGLLERFTVIDFNKAAARKAAEIVELLKKKRKTIDKPDLFIAATAIVNGLDFDTLNTKHFIDIDELSLWGI